jgi:hypothetical protein
MRPRPAPAVPAQLIADLDHALADLRATALRDAIALSTLCRQRRLLEQAAALHRQQARAAIHPVERAA